MRRRQIFAQRAKESLERDNEPDDLGPEIAQEQVESIEGLPKDMTKCQSCGKIIKKRGIGAHSRHCKKKDLIHEHVPGDARQDRG